MAEVDRDDHFIQKVSNFILCYNHPIKFDDLARYSSFSKGKLMEKNKEKLQADSNFIMYVEKGELMINRQRISEEESLIRDTAVGWKGRVVEYFKKNGLQTPIKLSELIAAVPRPEIQGVDTSSIPSKCILEADYDKKFDFVNLREKPWEQYAVKYVYSQEEWRMFQQEGTDEMEARKEEWRKRIISHLLNQRVAVRLKTLSSVAKKPGFLPPKVKCADVIRQDPFNRFHMTGPPNNASSSKGDSGMLLVSLTREFLAEHWRLQIIRHMTSLGVNVMLLSDIGNVVPKPILLHRQFTLAEVINTDPLGRFMYTSKFDNCKVKLLTEEERQLAASGGSGGGSGSDSGKGVSSTTGAASSPSNDDDDDDDGWTVVGGSKVAPIASGVDVAEGKAQMGAWTKKIYAPPPGQVNDKANQVKVDSQIKERVAIAVDPSNTGGKSSGDKKVAAYGAKRVVVSRPTLAKNALQHGNQGQGQGQGQGGGKAQSSGGGVLTRREKDMNMKEKEKEDKDKKMKKRKEEERKEEEKQQRKAKEKQQEQEQEHEWQQQQQQQSRIIPLMEEAPVASIFDFEPGAPGLFKSNSYFHSGGQAMAQDNNNSQVDMGLNFDDMASNDPLQMLSMGLLGESVPAVVPTVVVAAATTLSADERSSAAQVPVPADRMWIRNWLPKSFDGFPSSIIDHFVSSLAEEGMVSVQDLLTAQDLGQLTLDYLKEIGIVCKLGHYNRLVSALSKIKK